MSRWQPHRTGNTRIGGDGIEFWGQSFVAGTSGQILAKASVDGEENLIVPVDLGQRWMSPGRTGRSCAIVGSTPTAI
jgi:predicted amidohydrolase